MYSESITAVIRKVSTVQLTNWEEMNEMTLIRNGGETDGPKEV